jgi:hypothetical protein
MGDKAKQKIRVCRQCQKTFNFTNLELKEHSFLCTDQAVQKDTKKELHPLF